MSPLTAETDPSAVLGSPRLLAYIQHLGREIERQWKLRHFDNRALPDLACQLLSSTKPSDHVSFDDIADWLSVGEHIPPQGNLDTSFGQPPVTLYWNQRFYIEALHWTTATTQIHQHGFSGAFCVLAGSSLQSTYSFQCRRRLNVHALFGDLTLESVALLSTGDVQPIRSGDALIHSVFHLDFPSVTLVVRTQSDIESKPQYSYWPPSLAVDPYFTDPVTHRRLQILEFLRRIESPRFEAVARRSLATSDPLATYTLLRGLSELCPADVTSRLLEVARHLHADEAGCIWDCVQEARRQSFLIRARANVKAPEGRFLLALLLNVRSRAGIYAAAQLRSPGRDPKEQILEWCFGLSRSDIGVEFDELNRALFHHLADGVTANEVVRRLGREFDSADVERMRPEILRQCQVLRHDSVFKYLLAESDQGA